MLNNRFSLFGITYILGILLILSKKYFTLLVRRLCGGFVLSNFRLSRIALATVDVFVIKNAFPLCKVVKDD
jgi:hypothetical protein